MQATEPFYELILRCDQEVCFERVSGFELENTTFSKIKLSMGGQKKKFQCQLMQIVPCQFQVWGILHQKYFRFSSCVMNIGNME